MAEPIIIRTSDRGSFKRCRTMWDFTSKIRQNWEPIQRYPAFDFGTAMHAGLEAYYDPKTWGDKVRMQAYAEHAFRSTFEDLQKLVRVGDLEFELRFGEDMNMGLRMLDYYFSWAPKHDNFTPIMTEIEFEVPIPGLEGQAIYQGRIDLVVEDEFGYKIVDHKTAKQFGNPSWLSLDDQCSSYAWALRQQLGLEIHGVVYNQLKKSPPHEPTRLKSGEFSRNKQQNTTFETYLKALRAEDINPSYYNDILLYLKQNPKEFIRRTQINFTDRSLNVVEERVRREARDMINPDIQIYPSPSMMNCNSCRFFVPCLQTQEGSDPSFDMYERRVSSSWPAATTEMSELDQQETALSLL